MNYDFKLKNFEATKARHAGQIKKLRRVPLAITTRTVWDKLIDSNWLEEIEGMLKQGYNGRGDYWWTYNVYQDTGRLHGFHEHQCQLNEVKTAINDATRFYIRQSLEFNDLPKSWDTAFYCLYYARINAGMKRLAKFYL